jgi:hypothetical protein
MFFIFHCYEISGRCDNIGGSVLVFVLYCSQTPITGKATQSFSAKTLDLSIILQFIIILEGDILIMETDDESSKYYKKVESIKKILSHRDISYLKTKKNLIWNSLTLNLQKLLQLKKLTSSLTTTFTKTKVVNVVLGTCLIAFAVYNIHIPANITDGGGLGLILLLNHWFNLPPFVVAPILDILLYIVALRFLGMKFLRISILSTISLAIF